MTLLTVSQAAKLAGVSTKRAYAKLHWAEERGLYTARRVGSVILVDPAFVQLLEWKGKPGKKKAAP